MSRKLKRILSGILLALLAGVFLYSAYRLVTYYAAKSESDRAAAQARRYVRYPEGTGIDREKEKDRLVVDFDELRQISEDVVGWLYSAGAEINHPVLQATDNAYYLYRLPDGTWNENGSLFLDYRSPSDFSGANSIIYGHNMLSGAMFGNLTKYRAQSFYDKNPCMYLATPQQSYRIDLFAGCVVRADDAIYQGNVTRELLQRYFTSSTFRPQFDAVPEGAVVTLSTCVNDYEEARYILLGVLVPLD